MPKMSGFELAREIWRKDPEARICFFSAYETYEKEAKALFPGLRSTCFLKKPMSIAQVVNHLGRHGVRPIQEPQSNGNHR